jgi:hypothetical protein
LGEVGLGKIRVETERFLGRHLSSLQGQAVIGRKLIHPERVGTRELRLRGRRGRIQRDRSVEQCDSDRILLTALFEEVDLPAEVEIVGFTVRGPANPPPQQAA